MAYPEVIELIANWVIIGIGVLFVIDVIRSWDNY